MTMAYEPIIPSMDVMNIFRLPARSMLTADVSETMRLKTATARVRSRKSRHRERFLTQTGVDSCDVGCIGDAELFEDWREVAANQSAQPGPFVAAPRGDPLGHDTVSDPVATDGKQRDD